MAVEDLDVVGIVVEEVVGIEVDVVMVGEEDIMVEVAAVVVADIHGEVMGILEQMVPLVKTPLGRRHHNSQ